MYTTTYVSRRPDIDATMQLQFPAPPRDPGEDTARLMLFMRDPDFPPANYVGSRRAPKPVPVRAGGRFFLLLAAIPTVGFAVGLFMTGVL